MLGCIGMGGMGQVYAAYDPQLDRKVALKVLHEDRDHRDNPRLIREAQALARLAHPNVVAVHDVGDHEGRLFVAMEFIEGVTLRDWLHDNAPGPIERLAIALDHLIQAGEGLAAAHRAGLVHRDFKPGNVLIGSEGRVRVVDFGLVRVEPGSNALGGHLKIVRGDEPPSDDELSALLDDRPLTRPGSLVGTPAYMAPEQFLMTGIDAATDQFAFCTTAWEAIFGVRPFPGKTIPAVLEAIRSRRPDDSPQVACPEALGLALRKGLAFGPGKRHPSMEALLDALKIARQQLDAAPPKHPPARHRAWMTALTVAGAVGATALALGFGESQVCTGAEAQLAGVWDDGVQAELEQAFLDTEAAFAPDVWARFAGDLDDYARRWTDGHRDACEATQVRKEQSTEQMDLRMACLYSQRQQLDAITEIYVRPDADMLARANDAVASLPPVDACADPDHVRRRNTVPKTPEHAAAVKERDEDIARSAAHEAAGHYAMALTHADAAVATASDLALPSTQARAHLQRGRVHMRLRQGERARDDLELAYLLAKEAELPEIAFESSRVLIQLNGVLLMRFDEGRWWARVGRSEVNNLGDEHEARLLIDLGALHHSTGRFIEAEQSYEQAVQLLGRTVGTQHLAYAGALQALGELRTVRGGPAKALPLLHTAMELAVHNLGPRHPSLARFHISLAEGYRLEGELDHALDHAQQALALSIDAFGSDHVALHSVLDEMASVQEDRGDIDEATAMLKRARGLTQPEPPGDAVLARLFSREGEIRFQRHDYVGSEQAFRSAVEHGMAALGDVHPLTARYRIGLGAAIGAQGRRHEAIALIEAGRALGEAMLGGLHPNVAVTHDALASEMERSGQLDGALKHTQRALEIYEASYGHDSFQLMKPHGNMCAILGQLGQAERAVEHCHAALDLAAEAVSSDESLLAKLHNNLGAALAFAHRWDEATVHYEAARKIWEHLLGPRHIMMGIVLANLGEVHLAQGGYAQAGEHYARSLEIREEYLGTKHPMIAVPLIGLANVAHARGDQAEAERWARRAVTVTQGSANDLTQARAQEVLARVLWGAPAHRTKANELAAHAGESFEQLGAQASDDRARLAAWWPGSTSP